MNENNQQINSEQEVLNSSPEKSELQAGINKFINECFILDQASKIVVEHQKNLEDFEEVVKQHEEDEQHLKQEMQKKLAQEIHQVIIEKYKEYETWRTKFASELQEICDTENLMSQLSPIVRDITRLYIAENSNQLISSSLKESISHNINNLSLDDALLVFSKNNIILGYEIVSEDVLKEKILSVLSKDARYFINFLNVNFYECMFSDEEIQKLLLENPSLKDECIDLLERDRDLFLKSINSLVSLEIFDSNALIEKILLVSEQNPSMFLENIDSVISSGLFEKSKLTELIARINPGDKEGNAFMGKLPFLIELSKNDKIDKRLLRMVTENFLLSSPAIYGEHLENIVGSGLIRRSRLSEITHTEFKPETQEKILFELGDLIEKYKEKFIRNN